MAYKDPEDHKAWCKADYAANKDRYLERNRLKVIELRQLIRESKNQPCMDCGESYPYYVMDFDHRDPSEKRFNVSMTPGRGRGAVLAEIAKCDVVCSNCHRIRTHSGVGELADPPGSEPGDFVGSMPTS